MKPNQLPPVKPLDDSKVRNRHACLEPVANDFISWYNKHAPKMSESERNACQDALDGLTPGFHGLMMYPDNNICKSCLGMAGSNKPPRDLLFCHFVLLRLLFVKHQKQVMDSRVDKINPKPLLTAETVAQRFMKGSVARLIQERYGESIDLWTEQFPRARPRPQRWPALGGRLQPLPPSDEEQIKTIPKRKKHQTSALSDSQDEDHTNDSDAPLQASRAKRARHGSGRLEPRSKSLAPPSKEENSAVPIRSVEEDEVVLPPTTCSRKEGHVVDDANSDSRVAADPREDNQTMRPQISIPAKEAQSSDDPADISRFQSKMNEEIRKIHEREEERLGRDERLYEACMGYAKLASMLPKPDDQTTSLVPKVGSHNKRIKTLEEELEAERERRFDLEARVDNLVASLRAQFPKLNLDKATN